MADNKIFESIMNGLNESLAYAKGDASKARKMCVTVAELPKYHDKALRGIPVEGVADKTGAKRGLGSEGEASPSFL